MGFMFSESYFNETNQLCHTMMVTINATESVNASRIRCEYCLAADRCSRSDEATLLVIASKILFTKVDSTIMKLLQFSYLIDLC